MEIKNKKAYFDYEILKEIEVGIALIGTEVKSVRKGSVDLKDSFVNIKNNEAFVINMYISKYEEGNRFNHDERRTRKLLLHKSEIIKLKDQKSLDGISLIPLKIYLKNGKVKLLLGIGKGKKLHDKRESLKKKTMEREQRNYNF
ncbi:MAG: SsrA-binding protein SmpB [Bacilli bacterium]|nr:SsrA-binding protein SmpB [Bacilli bacterium]